MDDQQVDVLAQTLFGGFYRDDPMSPGWEERSSWGALSNANKGRWRRAARAALNTARPLSATELPPGIAAIWEAALTSIARNTCCDRSHEAALVAQQALSAASPQLIASLSGVSDDDHPR